MKATTIQIGERFGDLTVVGAPRSERDARGMALRRVRCRCRCGVERDLPVYELIRSMHPCANARREQQALDREAKQQARREQQALDRQAKQQARREQQALDRQAKQQARREQQALDRQAKQQQLSLERAAQPRLRSCSCGQTIVEARSRDAGGRLLLEPSELTPRGPCPRCCGCGVDRNGCTCPTCRGAGLWGVVLTDELVALDALGRARPIAPADRSAGEALHRAHRCAAPLALELSVAA